VRPLAERLAGDSGAFAETPVRCRLLEPVANEGTRTFFLPCRLLRDAHSELQARPAGFAGSHDVAGMAHANALLVLEPGASLQRGSPSVAYPLPWSWPVE
jgi:molybdopterin biosynthesis enzyme